MSDVRRYHISVGAIETAPLIATDDANRAADVVDLLTLPAWMVDSQTGRVVYKNKKARQQEDKPCMAHESTQS